MTSVPPIVEDAEDFLRQLAGELLEPRAGECLCCYVARMLDEFPCDGSHRHAIRYRDAMVPRATALATRLGRIGACCCDCELFMNGYRPRERPQDDETRPPCGRVRRGSLQPCANWLRIQGG